ncbi:MAG: TonB-dependent receptor [Pseudomonadota bacterium]
MAQTDNESTSGAQGILDVVVVTATKKAGGVDAQDAPVAITAFGTDQLDAFQVRNMGDLSFKMPNISLDDIGTAPGSANFAIRGLGVNSSIPSIEPAVGVFVDGMYLGINQGVITDTFDLESVEALRGPQGVLFGRNVTGGAILINTMDPTDEFVFQGKVAAESGARGTGANFYAQAVLSGPIMEDVLSGKIAVYQNEDDGWFENGFDGQPFGENQTTVVRGALKFTPNDVLELILKYETGDTEGEGPAGQSHTNGFGVDGQIVNFDRDSFDFSIDERGSNDSEWDQFIVEANIGVPFGDGTITNIFGWREFAQLTTSDIDSTPAFLFHADASIEQDQVSNELRYNGTFFDGALNFTTGAFFFEQNINYGEARRLLGGASTQDGGGVQDHRTIGLFVQGDYFLSDRWGVNVGIRYTDEDKDVWIASLIRNINSQCVVAGNDNRVSRQCSFDFVDQFSTDNLSPKIGLTYEANESLRFYGHWARAFRAGGYNFRNTAIDTVNLGPGPFEDEQIDSFEIGFKSEPGNARFNGAIFLNQMTDLQREINLADPIAGVVQVIRNTADADIWGIELDLTVSLTDNFVFNGAVGYVDSDYSNVIFDLNGDGVINGSDESLDIPRLAPLTLNAGLSYFVPTGFGEVVFNTNYAYRDEAAYTDDNRGFLNEQNRLDASISFDFVDAGARLTFYGNNLSNEVQHGNDTQLPSLLGPVPLGGTFAPLMRGRRIGMELQWDF